MSANTRQQLNQHLISTLPHVLVARGKVLRRREMTAHEAKVLNMNALGDFQDSIGADGKATIPLERWVQERCNEPKAERRPLVPFGAHCPRSTVTVEEDAEPTVATPDDFLAPPKPAEAKIVMSACRKRALKKARKYIATLHPQPSDLRRRQRISPAPIERQVSHLAGL